MNLKAVFFVVVLINFSGTFGEKHRCVLSFSGTRCEIVGLNITEENYVIEPETSNNNDIKDIKLQGIVRILSKEVISKACETFQDLTWFQASGISLEEIAENTFQSCQTITYIDMRDNNFIKLHRNSFTGLVNLGNLELSGGNVPVIDLDLKDLKQLRYLFLRDMNISVFPADTIIEQTKLEVLYLFSNNLFDLDVEGFLPFTRALRRLWITDNNFKCSRLKVILPLLNEKNIEAVEHTYIYPLKSRTYTTTDKFHEITCLNDELWESEIQKYPIAKGSADEEKINHIVNSGTFEVSALINIQNEVFNSISLQEKLLEQVENLLDKKLDDLKKYIDQSLNEKLKKLLKMLQESQN